MDKLVRAYLDIFHSLPKHVTLVAVSKFHSSSDILKLYDAGCRDFGESRVQELIVKRTELPKDINWHFIGHLQTNKVKEIVTFIHLIHSVDSEKLLSSINIEAKKNDRIVNCLLQVHIAREETKYGFIANELDSILCTCSDKYPNVAITGLMGMASYTESLTDVFTEFSEIQTIFDHYKDRPQCRNGFDMLSIGMSGDYKIAIGCGSTIVRIGSLIFGER